MLPLPSLDRPTPAPLPLSQREQQVCEYLSQRMTFETIALHLGLSPAAARAYYRRALSKRQRTIALTSLEQGDSSAPRVRKTTAKPEPALTEPPRDRLASNRSQRSPFHSPAVEAPVLLERPNAIVPSLFVRGDRVTTRRKLRTKSTHFSQTTITELPRHPFRRKRTSRRSRRTGVGFCVAVAS